MLLQNKKIEKEFFDRFDQEGGYERFDERGYRRIFCCLESTIAPKEGDTLVDIGCGSGAFTYRLSLAYPRRKILGLDISVGCIARASKQFRQIPFLVADAEATGLPSASVDIICYSGLLHHFPDFEKVAQEAFRILKPGGRFFSFDPHHYNPVFWLYRSRRSPFYSSIGVTPNERLITAREVREVFSRAGFEVHSRVISGVTFCYVESTKVNRVLPFYNFFDRILGMTPLAKIIGAWAIGWGVKVQ